MLRVGLTGGLATGKSFVGRTLAAFGCQLLQADHLGHLVLLPGGEAYEPVVVLFGKEILASDGSIDRKLLGAIVFGKPDLLATLSQLVHPHVLKREEQWLRTVEAQDPSAIAVVEAAILIETGSFRRFSKIVLTVCTEEQQVRRAMDRDQLPEAEVRHRLERQMPLEEKRKFAHYVIDTSGSKENTIDQVRVLYSSLRSLVI
jgi:dephospho-CoA kinase